MKNINFLRRDRIEDRPVFCAIPTFLRAAEACGLEFNPRQIISAGVTGEFVHLSYGVWTGVHEGRRFFVRPSEHPVYTRREFTPWGFRD